MLSLNFCFCKDDGQWGADIFNGHAIGCNAVSWAPATQPGSLITPQQNNAVPGQPPVPPQSAKRFASAGCDNLVKIWGYRDDSQSWVEEETLEGHTDWVRDVAWAPNIGLPRSYIATASQVRHEIVFALNFVQMCIWTTGQECYNLDKRQSKYSMGQNDTRPFVCIGSTNFKYRFINRKVSRCCLASVLESCWKHFSC